MRKTRSDIEKEVANYISLSEKNDEIRLLRLKLLYKFGMKHYLEHVINVDFLPCAENKIKYKAVSKPDMPEADADFVNERMLRNVI